MSERQRGCALRPLYRKLSPKMSDFISARDSITPEFIAEVCQRIQNGGRVYRLLPDGGRLHIDRPLPFLSVHRLRHYDAGSGDLLLGQGSFLIAPTQHKDEIKALIEAITQALADKFGAVLLLEVWTRPADESPAVATADEAAKQVAQFRVYSNEEAGQTPVSTARLQRALGKMDWPPTAMPVEATVEPLGNALDWQPFLGEGQARERACRILGLEVPPLFRESNDGPIFPASLQSLRRELGIALQKTFYEFMQVQTDEEIEDFRALGLRKVGSEVWETDREIAEIAANWNFLLGVTPVNAESQWREFRQNKFAVMPIFHDRLLPFDPDLLKRQLYNVELERVESPALAALFHEKRLELDRQITLLEDRNTPRFLPGSMALYGGIEAPLLELANQILERTAPATEDEEDDDDEREARRQRVGGPATPKMVGAHEFARRAQEEIDFYRAQWPDLSSKVEVRNDVPGVMVAAGQLLIAENFTYPEQRLEALIQHEVGTHIVSHANGKAQPLKLLYIGFPDYDPLQEGTALLAEWLCGGLHPLRVRLLAARVWAVNSLISGADFIETFRALREDHGFSARASWSLTMRVYRGGGFTKDAVYLRGLAWLLEYLSKDGEFDLLWSGKISGETLSLVRELHLRGVLNEMKLRPRFLDTPAAQERIAQVRAGMTVLDLLDSLII